MIRSEVQADVDRLTKEADDMEHQWSATKEVCHREFGPIAEDVAAPVTEAKGKGPQPGSQHHHHQKDVKLRSLTPLLLISFIQKKIMVGFIAKAEHDIKLLQDQIASLQRQLDAVSVRRKQMAADAEEQQQRLAEQGAPIDDDEEEDA